MKKVYRSRHTKVLGGVAAGLGEYFGMDATVMRLLFALLLVTVPNVVIAYILAWIIIPEEPVGMSSNAPSSANTGGVTMSEEIGGSSRSGMTASEILKNQGEQYVPDVPGAPQVNSQAPWPSVQQGQSGSAPVTPVSVSPTESKQAHGSGDKSRQLMGYILIAIGAAVIFKRFVPHFVWRLPGQIIGQAWPVIIILAGVAIIFGAVRGR